MKRTVKATYLFDGLFTLEPEYNETIQFNFETHEFVKPNFDDDDIDYEAMYRNPRLQMAIAKRSAK
jgi:hypothetical protein